MKKKKKNSAERYGYMIKQIIKNIDKKTLMVKRYMYLKNEQGLCNHILSLPVYQSWNTSCIQCMSDVLL